MKPLIEFHIDDPTFDVGETHTAHVVLRNPTTTILTYDIHMYLEGGGKHLDLSPSTRRVQLGPGASSGNQDFTLSTPADAAPVGGQQDYIAYITIVEATSQKSWQFAADEKVTIRAPVGVDIVSVTWD